mmetsp:Transcript_103314/g.202575  ORF Transcript_103314/g.202575 Transcript_103314/m.202575 type:complete len:203 (+) Transcript_103314:3-611(+)
MTKAPIPTRVAEGLLHSLPSVLFVLVGEFAAPAAAEAYLGAVEACATLAMSGDGGLARALWLATCTPIPSAGAAAARGFAEFADRFGDLAASVILPQDLSEMAACLRPRAGGHTRSSFAESELARQEVLRARYTLQSAAVVLETWPMKFRLLATVDARELCEAAADVARAAHGTVRDDAVIDALSQQLRNACEGYLLAQVGP